MEAIFQGIGIEFAKTKNCKFKENTTNSFPTEKFYSWKFWGHSTKLEKQNQSNEITISNTGCPIWQKNKIIITSFVYRVYKFKEILKGFEIQSNSNHFDK